MVYKNLNSIDLDGKQERGQAVRRLWLVSKTTIYNKYNHNLSFSGYARQQAEKVRW